MVHPQTTLRHVNERIGDGVFATRFIPKGTLVYVKDPLEIELSPAKFSSLRGKIRQMADKYSYIDQRGYRILSWDIAKFVNHRCEANTMSTGWGFEVAVMDIEEGDQITDEYGLFNLEWDIECECGSPHCRGVIRPTDIYTFHEKWDALIQEALNHLREVDQPLWEFVDDRKRRDLLRYLKTGTGYRSVLELRYEEPQAITHPPLARVK